MDNMIIYEQSRSVPPEAQKKISGGRLNGMTDINPMWRIKMLTQLFGACGIGWYTQIVDKRTEVGADGTIAAFVDINLYIKDAASDTWSAPISGTGGSMLVAKERSGLYTSDECFKMAYTDAISVCCKMLGFGADIYWNGDRTKYTQPSPTAEVVHDVGAYPCEDCKKDIPAYHSGNTHLTSVEIAVASKKKYGKQLCVDCGKKHAAQLEPA